MSLHPEEANAESVKEFEAELNVEEKPQKYKAWAPVDDVYLIKDYPPKEVKRRKLVDLSSSNIETHIVHIVLYYMMYTTLESFCTFISFKLMFVLLQTTFEGAMKDLRSQAYWSCVPTREYKDRHIEVSLHLDLNVGEVSDVGIAFSYFLSPWGG